MITASSLRSARKRLMKKLLFPKGFVEKGSLYSRHVGNQFHGIDFQALRYGGQYTVNVTFHYDFLPVYWGERTTRPLDEMELLDFWLRTRLGRLLTAGAKEIWWPYGKDLEEAKSTLTFVATKAMEVLDRYAESWSAPQVCLELVPPSRLEKILPPADVFEMDEERANEAAVHAFWEVLPEWNPRSHELAYGLCVIALNAGEFGLAKEYGEIAAADPWIRDAAPKRHRDAWALLRAQAEKGLSKRGR